MNAGKYRKLLYHAYHVNFELNTHLSALLVMLRAFENMPVRSMEQISVLVENQFQELRKKIGAKEQIDRIVDQELKQIDASRGSWTNED